MLVKFEYSSGILFYKQVNGKRLFVVLKRGKSIDVPKGHIEKEESAYSAAKRESFEETGIEAEPDRYFRHWLTYWFYGKGERNKGETVKKRVTMFIAEVPASTEVKVSDEHSNSEWLDYEGCMKTMRFKQQRELIRHADDYINRKHELERINHDYAKLAKRDGFELSKNFVPGDGPCDAEIMIIGQAPGATEDIELRPFVGRAGKFLDSLIRGAGLRREQIYITSVVQFFPPDNRQPSREEIEVCLPFLKKQILVVDPLLIICLGKVSAMTVTGRNDIVNIHGTVIPIKLIDAGIGCFVTMHPAAGVRFNKNVLPIRKDFSKLRNILKELRERDPKAVD